MNSMTITLNADGTFSDASGTETLTLRQVINLARVRREAARKQLAETRKAQKIERKAAKIKRLEKRAAKDAAELKKLRAA